MKIRLIIFLILSASCLLTAQAQSLKFDRLSVQNGLSENLVSCIFQDSKGFMWFGTQDGLNRYDGYKFKVFRHEPGNMNSLSDYAVNAILEDDSGFIWIATRNGLNKFNPQTEIFKNFQFSKNKKNTLSDNFITAIITDTKNNLWIGTKNGLNRLDLKNYKFSEFKNEPSDSQSLSANYITSIYFSSDGNLWIGTFNGLNKFNSNSSNFTRYMTDSEDKNKVVTFTIYSIVEDKNKNLWIGTHNGLDLFPENDAKNFIRHQHSNDVNSLSNNHVGNINIDNSGILWVTTRGGGLNKFDPNKNIFERYMHIENSEYSIGSNYLSSLYIDLSGVIWIGIENEGLNKLSPRAQKFIHIHKNENDQASLNSNLIQCFFEDQEGYLWIGTDAGLNQSISKDNFKNSAQINFNFKNINSHELGNKPITSMIEDLKGNFWIGTFGYGLFKIDKASKKITQFINQPNNINSLSHNYIHTLYLDKEDIIWIGTGLGGLVKFDPDNNEFKSFKPNPNDTNSISSVEVNSIIEEGKYLWVGTTTGGLNKFDKEKEIFTVYKHDPQKLESISSTRINTLYKDKLGNLWIGTFGGGLNEFVKRENSFIHYTTKDGLPSNTIVSIAGDDKGNLWLSTTNGISKFNPDKKSFKNYNVSDGLQANEFIENSIFKNPKTGYIYLGGINGFNVFHPDSLKEDNYAPKIEITDFKIYNKSVPIGNYSDGSESPLKKNISYLHEITLPYDNDVFSFEFASLHFANPSKNKYAYKMEGFDKDWIQAGTNNSASYTNLDPGSYMFKVKGTNSDGIWNAQEASIKINITPPWWLTWWAYLIYASIFIAGLVTVRRYEVNRIKLKNDLKLKEFETNKLNEVDKLKSRFFANISHEFRTPLTLILGLLEKYLKKPSNDSSDFKVMKKNAQRLLQLINQILELSKIESGNVRLKVQKTEFYRFTNRIVASFISLAEHKQIKLKFNDQQVSKNDFLDELYIYIDREKIETVIYNLLSNALKFTPAFEKVLVNLIRHESEVELRVTNTGISIPKDRLSFVFDRFYQVDESSSKAYEGTGIGLALVKELTELHHGKIMVDSLSGVETTFYFTLPLGKNHFTADQLIENDNSFIEEETIDQSSLAEEENTLNNEAKIKSVSNASKLSNGHANLVLVVEDHFDLRNFICEQLENDYTIIEAEDGEKGLKLAEEFIPDLVVSDIMMPKMDGYDLCKELKSNLKTNHIPVILLTAKAGMENKLEGLEIGADDYLIKPFNTDELIARVKNLIHIRQQMREKFQSEMILKPAAVIVPSNQKLFIEKLTRTIEEHIEDENLSVEILCNKIGLSRSQLHRKVKAICNQSTSEFIRSFRLQRAADLIKQNAGNMAEISYKVGFNSQAYFTKSFQEMYGCTPGDYKKKNLNLSLE